MAVCFILDLWGDPGLPAKIPPPDAVFAGTETARLSVAELTEADGDLSGLDCYACHEEQAKLSLTVDAEGIVILPADHKDVIYSRLNCTGCHSEEEGVELDWDDEGRVLIPPAHSNLKLLHGRNRKNNDCFNCHDRSNLRYLVTRDGRQLEPAASNELCADCHGPKYRDWEIGIHGRLNGYWDRNLGEARRKDCTSCHDPHAPMFPKYKPGPAPQPVRVTAAAHAAE